VVLVGGYEPDNRHTSV